MNWIVYSCEFVQATALHRTDTPNAGPEGHIMGSKYAYRATLAEIRSNDFSLNLPCCIDTFEEEETVDISAIKVKIEQIRAKLAEI